MRYVIKIIILDEINEIRIWKRKGNIIIESRLTTTLNSGRFNKRRELKKIKWTNNEYVLRIKQW
jgi:hypothetical protein